MPTLHAALVLFAGQKVQQEPIIQVCARFEPSRQLRDCSDFVCVELEVTAVRFQVLESRFSHFIIAALLLIKDQVVLGRVGHELALISAKQGRRNELQYAHLLNQLNQVQLTFQLFFDFGVSLPRKRAFSKAILSTTAATEYFDDEPVVQVIDVSVVG